MRRLAAHQSVGNLYEDVQRNDSAAGVIPRIIIAVDCCASIIYDRHVPVMRAAS